VKHRAASLLTLLGAWPSIASAATDAHSEPGAHAAPTSDQWLLLAFAFANFIMFALLIRRFASAPLRDFLSGRRRALVLAMEEAARLKAEAEQVKREYEKKVAELDQARAELVAEIRAIAEADRDRALAEASRAAERLKDESERTAQSDLQRAKQELRAEAARLAEEIARNEILRRMTEQDRRRLLGEFLDKVRE